MQANSQTSSFVSSAGGLHDKGYQGPVSKLSKRQWFFHERYLVVKNGIISYYSARPDPTRSDQHPKAKISAADCQVAIANPELSKKKKRPNMFQITFFSQAATKRTSVTWIFAVESQEKLQEWLGALHRAQLPEPDVEEEHEEVKQVEASHREEETKVKIMRGELLERERKEREEQRRIQELDKRKARQREKEQEETRRKQQIELELKRLQEEAEKKRQEQLKEARRAKYQKLLEHSWDYKFQKLWSRSFASGPFEESLKTGIRLFQHLGSFRLKTQATARLIVNELHLPVAQRQLQPINSDSQSVYVYQNIFFRVAWPQDSLDSVKLFGHEFRAADMLAEALFVLARKDPTMTFRVPLMCVVDYKGFRVLAVALTPLDGDHTLLHGPSQEGIYEACLPLYRHLSALSQILNLKEHKFEWSDRMEPAYVHLSAFLQVHKSLGYADLENFVKETSGEEVSEEVTEHHYLLRLSDLLPVEAFPDSESNFSNRLRPEFLCDLPIPLSADGLINQCEETAPEDDAELIEAGRTLRTAQLTKVVELLDTLREMPLDSKSMTRTLHSHGVNMRYLGRIAELTEMPHVRDIAIVEALARTAKRLLFEEITALVLNYSDEGAVTDERGISENPKEFRRGEGLRAKQFEGNYMDTQAIQSAQYEASPTSRNRAFSKRLAISLQMPGFNETEKWMAMPPINPLNPIQMDNDIQACIIDFLNLLLGAGDETEAFWTKILLPLTQQRFQLPAELGVRSQINLRALLHAVGYHCGLRLVFFKDVQLGIAAEPFALQSLERVVEKWKVFQLKNSQYRILADKHTDYRDAHNHTLALQACNLHFRINKALNPEDDFYGDPALLADIGEIMLDTGDLEGAIKKAKESLVQVHPLHVEAVKPWCVLMRALMKKNMVHEALQCFDSALSALEFHWGSYHPLYATVCSILAYLYLERKEFEDALVLYKSSLVCCLKVLGPGHMQTAEVYSELSTLYSQMGSWADALVACEKAFRILEVKQGETAPATLALAAQLCRLFSAQGRTQEAVQLISQVVETHERLIAELKATDSEDQITAHRQKVFEALNLGLELANRLQDSPLISLFGSKMWTYLENGYAQYSEDLLLMLLRHMVKTVLYQMPADQRCLFLSALVNSDAYEVNVEPEHLRVAAEALKSPNFLQKTKEKGGVKMYLMHLFEGICKSYGLIKVSARFDEGETLRRALTDVAVILEAVGADVIEL